MSLPLFGGTACATTQQWMAAVRLTPPESRLLFQGPLASPVPVGPPTLQDGVPHLVMRNFFDSVVGVVAANWVRHPPPVSSIQTTEEVTWVATRKTKFAASQHELATVRSSIPTGWQRSAVPPTRRVLRAGESTSSSEAPAHQRTDGAWCGVPPGAPHQQSFSISSQHLS